MSEDSAWLVGQSATIASLLVELAKTVHDIRGMRIDHEHSIPLISVDRPCPP
jgi:hypothetical protein